eukprot:2894436-Rhodomonas_salina.2
MTVSVTCALPPIHPLSFSRSLSRALSLPPSLSQAGVMCAEQCRCLEYETPPIALRACYALSGTNLAFAASGLYALSGTDLA